MVRQPQCLANSGAWTNGMPLSMTLGCGPKPPPIFHPPRGGCRADPALHDGGNLLYFSP
jgi:hypothetical protein